MDNSQTNQMIRVLGLKEAISMTVGTVVGVGLFTCGSSQIGIVGPWIIILTLIALLISIWPCLIYGEMSALLPCTGGTYNYAKRGLNKIWASLAGWHYIIAVVAIGAGETLAFANYLKILLEQFSLNTTYLDSRVIAVVLVVIFLLLNLKGIEQSGKAQTIFMFFFWACSISWFLYMIPKIHIEYFGSIAINSLPPFKEIMYILGLIWWCYTGFETCVSMGAEIKYPQYTLPRALKISIFLVFSLNALFQWFLVGLVPKEFYGFLAIAVAPYAEGLKVAGLTGFPIILLCIGIAFGGDLSTINPGIAAPARYIYAMSEDGALPEFISKIHPRYKTPYISIIIVGIINIILIITGSINYIASVSLISLAICYIIGCLSYLGLKKRYPNIKRPYEAPLGKAGCIVTILIYIFMLIFSNKIALITAIIISFDCILYWFIFSRKKNNKLLSIEDEIGVIIEPSNKEIKEMNKQYNIWKIVTLIICIITLCMYAIPILYTL